MDEFDFLGLTINENMQFHMNDTLDFFFKYFVALNFSINICLSVTCVTLHVVIFGYLHVAMCFMFQLFAFTISRQHYLEILMDSVIC